MSFLGCYKLAVLRRAWQGCFVIGFVLLGCSFTIIILNDYAFITSTYIIVCVGFVFVAAFFVTVIMHTNELKAQGKPDPDGFPVC
ncbi:MAG: hypothetical protein OXC46_08620 [Thaumarchaeota archaeon]|nr:hypothetical protein [Nitrososphaerota archaeon]